MADQSLIVNIGANISGLTSSMAQASQSVARFSQQTQQTFAELGKIGAGMAGIGLAIGAGLGVAVSKASDFDTAVRKAASIAGASASEFDAMKAAALELGAASSKSSSEIANAYTELAAKGYNANQVIAAMPGIVKAAEASGEDLAMVADTVTSAINAFGMAAGDANKVADVMAMTANKSAAGVMDLQYAFKYAAAPAAQLGISMEELAAATGLMVDAGLAGEQAGTTLRASLLRLVKPPKMARDALADLGVSATNQDGTFKNLNEIIGELQKGLEGMTDAQKAASLGAIFGTESVSGMMTLVAKGPEVLNEFSKALENSGGMAAKTAEQMKAGIGGALERLSGSIESFVIAIGDQLLPYVVKMAEYLSSVMAKFNGLSDSTKKFIAVGAALTAGLLLIIGPLLMLIGFIPQIVLGFKAVASAGSWLMGVITGISSTVLIVVGVIAAIGIALVLAYNHISWFRDAVDAAWAWIKVAFSVALEFIIGIVKSVMSAVASFIGDRLSDITKWWSENGSAIIELAKFAFSFLKSYIQAAMGYISMIFQTIFPIIVGVVKIAWAVIQAVFSTAVNFVLGLIGFFAKVFTGDFSGALESAKNTASRIWQNIVSIFKSIDLAEIGRNIIQGLINGLKSMGSAVSKAVSGIAGAIPAKIKSFLGIHSPSRVLMELGEFSGEGFAKGIQSMIGEVKGATADMASAALPSLAYDAPRVAGQAYARPLAATTSQSSTVNLTLNYSGSGSEQDARGMLDMIERGLSDRLNLKARFNGLRA